MSVWSNGHGQKNEPRRDKTDMDSQKMPVIQFLTV